MRTTRNNFSIFITAALVGCAFYAAFLWLINREDLAVIFGWIFFWPQYLVGQGSLVSFIVIGAYYGLSGLSFTQARRAWVCGFFVSGMLFLCWQYWMMPGNIVWLLGGWLFWPASLLLIACKDAHISHLGWVLEHFN